VSPPAWRVHCRCNVSGVAIVYTIVRRIGSLVAACAVLASLSVGCSAGGSSTTSFTSSRPAGRDSGATSWLALGGGADVLVPRAWQRVSYHGLPATVVFPIVFLTDGKLQGPCVTGRRNNPACTGQAWFARGWKTPSHGVLLDWLATSFPTPPSDKHFLAYIHARKITLDHRPAKITKGPVDSCPTGTATEIDAYIQRARSGYPGARLDMQACLGPHAPSTTRRAVMRMLNSLHFHHNR
jgi:hypothetical protein